MPLLIHVKKGKKIFINGAVLENATERTMTFLLRNKAEVLRCDDVLPPQEAATPAGRIYYALQCLYLFPDYRPRYLSVFSDLVESYRAAAPSVSALVERLFALVRAGQFYESLKLARELIAHEGQCLQRLDACLAERADKAAVSQSREAAIAEPHETVAG